MTEFQEFKIGAAQSRSFHLDKVRSTEKACTVIKEAGESDVRILGFGETWLPGYPFFHGDPVSQLAREARADYLANAIDIPGPETDALCEAARNAGTDVVIGVVEKDPHTAGTTYATLIFISSEGEILGRHRKLKPTGSERTVWGEGDGSGLRVHDRGYARISGLNCFEHIMMLPGYTLMAQGTQVHVSAWPAVNEVSKGEILSRAFAVQAGCYVIAAGAIRIHDDVPEKYHSLHESGVQHVGGSCIVDPNGQLVASGEDGVESIVSHTISLQAVSAAKMGRDVGGHYSRPDVFDLRVDRRKNPRVTYVDSPPDASHATNGAQAEDSAISEVLGS